mgnify:CR=1 FL=1
MATEAIITEATSSSMVKAFFSFKSLIVANPFTNVEYELNADQASLQAALSATGYICTVVDNQPQQ